MIGPAPAKINLALVVGPIRENGKHELATVYQRVDLGDRISVGPAAETTVAGFPGDTIVRAALDSLGAPHGWQVRIEKHTPVAAGLGGGSSDAATALRLANEQLDPRRTAEELHELAGRVGADVPFFLRDGPQLGTADGTVLEALDLPQDFVVLLLLPKATSKRSTAEVYAAFDERGGSWATNNASRPCAQRSRECGGRATSPPCRPTIWHPRRSPASCSPRARFAPTSAAQARPSTPFFTGRRTPTSPPAGCVVPGAFG